MRRLLTLMIQKKRENIMSSCLKSKASLQELLLKSAKMQIWDFTIIQTSKIIQPVSVVTAFSMNEKHVFQRAVTWMGFESNSPLKFIVFCHIDWVDISFPLIFLGFKWKHLWTFVGKKCRLCKFLLLFLTDWSNWSTISVIKMLFTIWLRLKYS